MQSSPTRSPRSWKCRSCPRSGTNLTADERRQAWRRERARVTTSFDSVADLYRKEFADELDRKPLDRELLGRVAPMFPRRRPVLEVGSGPGHVGARLTTAGLRVIVSDASMGQMREARALDPTRPLVAADLARLPVGGASLAGIVGFYCLIYGPAEELDDVFADWHRALVPGGVAVIAVHAGDGALHVDDWQGRAVDLTVVLRDPRDMVERLAGAGFTVADMTVRPPYHDEHPTDRCYIVATRPSTAD